MVRSRYLNTLRDLKRIIPYFIIPLLNFLSDMSNQGTTTECLVTWVHFHHHTLEVHTNI